MNHVTCAALATQECFNEAQSGIIMIMSLFCCADLRMELKLLTRNQEEKSPPHFRKIAGLTWVILTVRLSS